MLHIRKDMTDVSKAAVVEEVVDTSLSLIGWHMLWFWWSLVGEDMVSGKVLYSG